jgi:hypothetical protein
MSSSRNNEGPGRAPQTSQQVRASYNRLRPLEKLQVEKRGWTLFILRERRAQARYPLDRNTPSFFFCSTFFSQAVCSASLQ